MVSLTHLGVVACLSPSEKPPQPASCRDGDQTGGPGSLKLGTGPTWLRSCLQSLISTKPRGHAEIALSLKVLLSSTCPPLGSQQPWNLLALYQICHFRGDAKSLGRPGRLLASTEPAQLHKLCSVANQAKSTDLPCLGPFPRAPGSFLFPVLKSLCPAEGNQLCEVRKWPGEPLGKAVLVLYFLSAKEKCLDCQEWFFRLN